MGAGDSCPPCQSLANKAPRCIVLSSAWIRPWARGVLTDEVVAATAIRPRPPACLSVTPR